MRRWILIAIASCSSPRPEVPDHRPPVSTADVAPTLEVITPARGAFVERGKLVVTGRTTDDGAVRVTVNGVVATTRPDGTFTATLDAASGMTILETHAIDATAHDVRDVRAVLVGPFARSDGSARAAIGAYLGPGGLAALGNALAGSARAIDFTAAAQALNPVYDQGSCVGAKVDVTDVTTGKVAVALIPKQNAIATAITVDDVVVHLDVRYRAACIGGTTTMTVRTKAVILGSLVAAVEKGAIRTALPNPVIELDAFQLDVGGLPRPVEFLLRKIIRPSVESALVKAIERKVPPLADARLAELLARPPVPALLGRPLTIDVAPTRIELATGGVTVAADAALVVVGGEGGRYATTPAGRSTPGADGMWVAADAVNQLLAGLWAAHAFERTFERSAVGPMAMLLDPKVQTVQLSLALPPTVRADGTLELAIGDLTLTTRDAGDGELQRFAVSVKSTLTAKPGALALTTGEPQVFAQVLAQDPALGHPLDGPAVEGIVKGAWALVAGMLDDALAHLPIPGLAGASLEIRSVTAREGRIAIAVGIKPN